MRLAFASAVLAAAGIQDVVGTRLTAEAMLDISYPIVESLLETNLGYRTTIDSYLTSAGGFGEYRFTNGFVDPDSVVVYNAPASGNPYAAVRPEYKLPTTAYAVTVDKGVLLLPTLTYYGAHSLVVIYDSGYEAYPDDENVLEVPFSLAQIAISAAVLAMNTHPSTQANRKDKVAKDVSGALYGYLQRAVEPMRRPRMIVEYPVFTSRYD